MWVSFSQSRVVPGMTKINAVHAQLLIAVPYCLLKERHNLQSCHVWRNVGDSDSQEKQTLKPAQQAAKLTACPTCVEAHVCGVKFDRQIQIHI